MTRLAAGLLFALMGSMPLGAQTPTPPPPGQTTTPPPAAGRVDRAPVNQDVKVEVTITDTFGATPTRKSVSMLLSDQRDGRIRSGMAVAVSDATGHASYENIGINVDAMPEIRPDGRIYLQLTVQYTPEPALASVSGGAPKPADINEQLATILIDGRPTVVSQSADPQSDRKVTLEVTATVIR